MSGYFDIDLSQWKDFANNWSRLAGSEDEFLVYLIKELGLGVLQGVKDRTPIGKYDGSVWYTTPDRRLVHFYPESPNTRVGGVLRRNWKITNVEKVDNSVQVTIYNNTYYAAWVEEGHNSVMGNWVEGKFMLELTIEELKENIDSIIGSKFEIYLSKFMGGK